MRITKSAPVCLLSLLAAWACCAVNSASAAPPAERELQAEADPADPTGKASRDPGPAWAAARPLLPADHIVRRIAFAPHGLNVFSTPRGSDAPVRTVFLHWDGVRYVAGEPEMRDSIGCTAPGAEPAQVDNALQALLATPAWQDHAASVGTLLLECLSGPQLHWNLLIEPARGYTAGVPIETHQVPFTPDAGG